MLKVLRHGNRTRIQNPVTKQWQEVVNVQFIEIGDRSGGANASMSESSDVLSEAVGTQTGLALLRVHTHPVLVTAIDKFPVDKEFPTLFINRKLYSTPQMHQQVGVDSRMIDGKPTYFTTSISKRELPDEDLRLSNEVLSKVNPEAFMNAQVGATAVETIEQAVDVTRGVQNQELNTSSLANA